MRGDEPGLHRQHHAVVVRVRGQVALDLRAEPLDLCRVEQRTQRAAGRFLPQELPVPAPSGSAPVAATRQSTRGSAAAANATIASLRSTPVTDKPWSASRRATAPVPQARSTARSPATGAASRTRSSAHGTKNSGTRCRSYARGTSVTGGPRTRG
jgi:hypothetical protein